MIVQAAPVSASASSPTNAIGRLNVIPLVGAQLSAALEILALLPDERRTDPHAQAMALQAYARDAGFVDDMIAAAALHARVTALTKWTAANDPGRQSDANAVIEAAARFPLEDGVGGITFEPGGFQEMVLFIEELPW